MRVSTSLPAARTFRSWKRSEEGHFGSPTSAGPHLIPTFYPCLYAADFLYERLVQMLAKQGVHTWVGFKEQGPNSALRPLQRYTLVVIVLGDSRGFMIRLPWEYEHLVGVDPETESVADAIRASASIPFFFRPAPWPSKLLYLGVTISSAWLAACSATSRGPALTAMTAFLHARPPWGVSLPVTAPSASVLVEQCCGQHYLPLN